MTRDELLARYDLIEQVTEGDVETHHALHQSGAVVMVHFLGGSPTRNTAVVQAVQRLGAGEGSSGKVLHVHDVEGQPVVVTRFITDFVSLDHWLATLGLPVAEVEMGGDETLILQPGEGLGRPLGAGAVLEPPPAPDEPAAPEFPPPPVESPRPPQEPPRPQGGGGEFTKMFSAVPPPETSPPVKPDQALTVETPRPPLDPPPPPADTPPSFSQTPPEPPPPPPAGSGGGEFTQMFKVPLSQEPEDRPTLQRPPGAGAVPPGAPPSNVPPPTGPKPPVPPPPAPGSGEFTKMFRAAPRVEQDRNPWTDPARKPPGPAHSPPPPQAAPPHPPAAASSSPSAPPPQDGPGEFTKFFKAPEAPREPPGGTDESLRYDQAGGGAGRADSPKPPDGAWSDALRSSTPSAKPPPPPAPPPEAPAGGGEFTQIFGRDTLPVPMPPPSAPGAGGQEQPPSGHPPQPASAPPPATPSPPRSSALPGGVPAPRKPRLPGPEALLRGGGVRAPTPRMPVAPQPRQLGQMAMRAAQAAPAAGPAPVEGASAGGEAKPGKGTRALAVGIGVVLILSLVLTLFFALWDFSEPAADTDATAQPAAEAEALPPDSVG